MGAAATLSSAAAAQSRQEQTEQAQEPDEHSVLSGEGLSGRSAAQLFGFAHRLAQRQPRSAAVRFAGGARGRDGARLRFGTYRARRTGVRHGQTQLAQRSVDTP